MQTTITKGNQIEIPKHVRVTDPCYAVGGTYNAYTAVLAIKPGTYNTLMVETDEDGGRVALNTVWHESVTNPESHFNQMVKTNYSIGVDSGQAGFVDNDYFINLFNTDQHDDWYENDVITFGSKPEPLTKEELIAYAKIKEIERNYPDFNDDEAIQEYGRRVHRAELEFELTYHIDIPTINLTNLTKQTFANFLSTPDNKGSFTTTGYGDGTYPLYIYKNENDEIVGLAIDFLNYLDKED